MTMEMEQVINTLDATFGLLGGFMALISAMIAFCIGGHQEFKRDSAILQEFYTTDKNMDLSQVVS
jgi:hypothetical protein